MAIRYLIDVDYTLMSMNEKDGIPVFNETLINELKRAGVNKIDILSRMDPTDLRQSKSLRILLIAHLEKNGIKVGKLLTSMDEMFINSGYFPNFELGDTYDKLMKPLEQAVNNLSQIKDYNKRYARTTALAEVKGEENLDIAQYIEYKNTEKKIKIIEFLVKNEKLSLNDTLKEAISKVISPRTPELSDAINDVLTNKEDQDFDYMLPLMLEFLNASGRVTLKGFYDELVQKAAAENCTPEESSKYKTKMKLIDWLVSSKVSSFENTVNEVAAKGLRFRAKRTSRNINDLIIDHEIDKNDDPSFNDIFSFFEELESAKVDKLGDIYDELVLSHKKYAPAKTLTLEERQLIDTYLLELKYYNNQRYIASLKYAKMNPHHNSDESKGKMYRLWVEQGNCKEAKVLYIDDSRGEREIIQTTHNNLLANPAVKPFLPAHLQIFRPPMHDGLTVDFSTSTHMSADDFKNEHTKIYEEKYNLLCQAGDTALKAQNSHLAVDCYKTAYIWIDSLGRDNTAKIKEGLIKKIVEAYKANNPKVDTKESEDFVADCISEINQGGVRIKLRVLEREIAIHKGRWPELYDNFSFSALLINSFLTKNENVPTEINRDFKAKILGMVNDIRHDLEKEEPSYAAEVRAECIRLLSSCNCKHDVYKQAVIKAMADIGQPAERKRGIELS